MTVPRVTAVVFDFGGVLLDWDPRHLYRKLFEDEEAMERFLGDVCTLEWHDAHDRGEPAERSCAALAAQHPDQADLILAWARRTEEMVAGPISGSVEILRELRDAGVRCYGLTNMEAETYPLRVARYAFLTWFEGTVVSAYEGMAKPDRAIFERLLSRYGLEPGQTVLIDDSPRNLIAAESLGIRTIRFTSPEALRGELRALGLL